jgi:NitT/TauT family transport system substrate-binding protein
MTSIARLLLAPVVAASVGTGAFAQETTIRMAVVRSIANAALAMAEERGYFKEFGIKVEYDYIASSANAMALLGQGKLNIIAGGISAGYFNALEKNIPIIITLDRVTTPIRHNLMLRPDLKDAIKDLKDLRGKIIASNATGSITTYEVGKMLERVGLTIRDVEIKILPFPQFAVGFENKAIDGALVIPPFTYQLEDRKLAVPFATPDDLVDPRPMSIAVNLMNTDWAKQNQELVRNFYVALMRGVRDYCQAYHGGTIRKDVVEALIKSGNERRPELLHKFPWPARNLTGRVNPESLLDIQAWYKANKLTNAEFPITRLVDYSYVDHANQKLGPFVLENKGSKEPGCR